MFKLGEYYVDEARDIADYLKDAGMKVDIRTFTSSRLEAFRYLEGKMSEIKKELDEKKLDSYARYLDALRRVLEEGATSENFRERIQLELEAEVQGSSGLLADLLDMSIAKSFVDLVLERNEIMIGEDVGGRLDDPIVRVLADEEKDEDSKLAKTTTVFTLEPCAEVYVDEFSAIFTEEMGDEFEDEYPDEYADLFFLGKLVSDLTEPSSGKIDLEEFSERCEFQMENDGNLLDIHGGFASEELARSLEKNDIIKIKGNTIKWKR